METVARTLSKKAKTANHADQIGISEALVQLGEILMKDSKYSSSIKVLERAEHIQKAIITDTILAVASAMKKQGKWHKKHGNQNLAKIYLTTADNLKASPSATNLKKAWDVHASHKPDTRSINRNDEPKEMSIKVERRLKRASTEAAPLAHSLKLLAKAKRNLNRQETRTMKRSSYR